MEMTIGELAATAAAAVDAADVRVASGRVTELPDERTIRYYATIGLLDRPSGHRGRTSLYDDRHLLQLVAIKRRQAQGRTLAEIQVELVGATDRALRRIAAITPPVAALAKHSASPPHHVSRAFWREAPSMPASELVHGVALGNGVTLLIPGLPTEADVDEIRVVAQPLLALLADRQLTESVQSHP